MTADPNSRRAGWQSLLGELVNTDRTAITAALHSFIPDASSDQHAAWDRSLQILTTDGEKIIREHPVAADHGTVLEYLLPREGGRRPDIILLQDAAILVVEFKNTSRFHLGDVDQVAAYARDLREYHSGCRDFPVIPILLYCGAGPRLETAGVTITTPDDFCRLVLALARKHAVSPPRIQLNAWMQGRYEPLPGIVAAARLLFQRQPLPFIRRARSYGIPQTVEHVLAVYEQSRAERRNHLVLLTGVPGAGKTLVGLQVVHSEQLLRHLPVDQKHLNPASFLSGNGPLVAVLQDALKSKAFVQDMHRFIREHAISRKEEPPHERLLVFDEAQRAWTGPKVKDFYKRRNLHEMRSEPQMLVDIADRFSDGCIILALIGSGQEIHTGEESGIQGWLDAVARSDQRDRWSIHTPAYLDKEYDFRKVQRIADDRLSLDSTIRSHAAAGLHAWVNGVLAESPLQKDDLTRGASSLLAASYPVLLTRDLDWAKSYARARFEGEPLRRYGLLASSKARNLQPYGVDNLYDRFFPTAKWFNAPPNDPKSCCRLDKPAQEFHCQGLELDLPIVCWGDDFWWDNGWHMRKTRSNHLVSDPFLFRQNTYRVLMTRGREGLVIFLPPDGETMDKTAAHLEDCGAMTLETRRSEVREIA